MIIALIVTNLITASIMYWHFNKMLIDSKLYPYFRAYATGMLKAVNVSSSINDKHKEQFIRDCIKCGLPEPEWIQHD